MAPALDAWLLLYIDLDLFRLRFSYFRKVDFEYAVLEFSRYLALYDLCGSVRDLEKLPYDLSE